MLIDQDETPLFLGAIHGSSTAYASATWWRPRRSTGAEVTSYEDTEAAVAALAPDTLVLTDGKEWADGAPRRCPRATPSSSSSRGRCSSGCPSDPRRSPTPTRSTEALDEVKPGRGHGGPAARRRARPGDRASCAPAGCCRRRPRRSSRSPASGRSSGCSTDEAGRGHLDLAARHPAAAGRREEPSPQAPAHLHHVTGAPGRRPSGPGASSRPRSPGRRRWPGSAAAPCLADDDPELPHLVAARQHLLLGRLRQPPDQGHLVHLVGLTLVCAHAHHLLNGQPSGRRRQHRTRAVRSLWKAPREGQAVERRWLRRSAGNATKGPPCGGPFGKDCSAASYSPTSCRVQYHWRWLA